MHYTPFILCRNPLLAGHPFGLYKRRPHETNLYYCRNPLLAGHPFGRKLEGTHTNNQAEWSRNPLLAGHPFGLSDQRIQTVEVVHVAIPY